MSRLKRRGAPDEIACAVVRYASENNLGRRIEPEKVESVVRSVVWDPGYAPQAPAPYSVPPRNMLVERRPPDRADRILLLQHYIEFAQAHRNPGLRRVQARGGRGKAAPQALHHGARAAG